MIMFQHNIEEKRLGLKEVSFLFVLNHRCKWFGKLWILFCNIFQSLNSFLLQLGKLPRYKFFSTFLYYNDIRQSLNLLSGLTVLKSQSNLITARPKFASWDWDFLSRVSKLDTETETFIDWSQGLRLRLKFRGSCLKGWDWELDLFAL